MGDRPVLTGATACEEFQKYYYLKNELTAFCRREGLSSAGSKDDLTRADRPLSEDRRERTGAAGTEKAEERDHCVRRANR